MKISIIAAFNPQFIIGINGKMPWHIPEDLKRFKRLTMGKPIIMGRKTWESIGSKPLPGRLNVVISRSMPPFTGENRHSVVKAESLGSALEWLSFCDEKEVFIIGGERVYAKAIPWAHRMYLTAVDKEFPAISDSDEVAYFPIKAADRSEWSRTSREVFDAYTFSTWERINA